MAQELVYNIPAGLIDAYSGRDVIIRSASSQDLLYSLWRADLTHIRFVQLLSPFNDTSVLEGSVEGIPIEMVLEDPSQFECLYDFANLLDSHPLRISIPAVRGFSKAVKLAVSLDYGVKLQIEQPDEFVLLELESVLDIYLHRSYVRQPIEFFQSLLTSFYRNEPVSLWDVCEENPKQVCYVADDGIETISRRFIGKDLGEDLSGFVDRFAKRLIVEKRECDSCEFFDRCRGYFKWSDLDYQCDGVKRVFRRLVIATSEVRRDLASYQLPGVPA